MDRNAIMEWLVLLTIATASPSSGVELVQYCRQQRSEALMRTNDEIYAYTIYLQCLDNE